MSTEESFEKKMDSPPKYGLKLLLNYKFPKKSKQIIPVKAKQIPPLISLTTRYISYYTAKKIKKKRPIMDYFNMISAQRIYGCPIGGIGGGTIGRGFRGEFCRFQLVPGLYDYIVMPECQFIVNIRNDKNETLMQSVLSTYPKPKNAPSGWEWNVDGANCEYTALYPRAWTTYDLSQYGVKLVCRQISPVIPHNYKDSCLPCAVFVWSASNVCNEKRYVSISFTWKEVLLDKGKNREKFEIERYAEENTCGVTIEQKICGQPCSFTIAKNKSESESIHENYCLFNVDKKSKYVWDTLWQKGRLMPEDDGACKKDHQTDKQAEKASSSRKTKHLKANAMGLSQIMCLEPSAYNSSVFAFTWDMPKVQFKKNGKIHKRFYTRYFGSDGIAGSTIASYALSNYTRWEKEIDVFQQTILSNNITPDWLKSSLMNELYYIADGGTIWFDVQDEYPDTDPRHHYGVFGYLEGHEYRMYNTYDVHFYASFALAKLWPNLQVCLQYMFRDAIFSEDTTRIKELYSGKSVSRKVKDSVPHDLGDPEEEPFSQINAYNIHDVSEWRDLTPKFILQVYRDYVILNRGINTNSSPNLPYIDAGNEDDLFCRTVTSETEHSLFMNGHGPSDGLPLENQKHIHDFTAGSILEMLCQKEHHTPIKTEVKGDFLSTSKTWPAEVYLNDMFPACEALAKKLLTKDKDGDGIPENSGFPDQTFDAWVMKGPSAYCGGLWITALLFLSDMCRSLNKQQEAEHWARILVKARDTYQNTLWSGTHYKFDTCNSNKYVCMAAQLTGHWYLRACGFSYELLPVENIRSALLTIYDNNVIKFANGDLGAVNGYIIKEGNKNSVDRTAIQSEEVWTGVTFSLAATMLQEGLQKEAFATAGGLVQSLNLTYGLNFETPEAMRETGSHRSIGYMRALAIWSIQHAIDMNPHLYG